MNWQPTTLFSASSPASPPGQPGDFVFLQFSGHGSYQPATEDQLEQDGRDEIFLAADTMMAPKDNAKYMPNVITDNEFAEAFKAIRKTGAFVWLVFDSCHSGTITRGAPGEEDDGLVMREIKPTDLGIDPAAFEQPLEDASATPNPIAAELLAAEADETQGGLVAFFAAQSTETTPEKGYEVTLADGSTVKQNYGVFTHTIFSALAKDPNMTYRQLAQSVLLNYAAGQHAEADAAVRGPARCARLRQRGFAQCRAMADRYRRRQIAQHLGRSAAWPRQGHAAAGAAEPGCFRRGGTGGPEAASNDQLRSASRRLQQ